MPSVIDHVRAVATVDDAGRLARRRAIRAQIAKRDQVMKLAKAQQERVAALDREADIAADMHREQTGPVQAELTELEARIINLTADREPIPDGLESRRLELLDIIHTSNEQLSETVDRIKRLRKEPAAEAQRLLSEVAQGAALEYTLMKPGVGNPHLLLAHFAATNATQWCALRVEAARKQVEKWKTDKAYRERLERWKAELESAGVALTEAKRLAEEIYRRLMDE